ncbi:PIN domain-containing protein [Pseudomonas sp. NPDC085632]|uniref:PIN domain-containing protein n=1 Tax=Pseudomonas sp. NPDC085632 TaxID=3364429 RepID=UPI0037C9F272
MPKGMPTPESVWDGDISFFSIDTDVIQAAGYHFETGALHQLHKQLPSSMGLQLTDIVATEVIAHQMKAVSKSVQEFKSASANLKRRADLPMNQIDDLFVGLDPEEASRIFFRKRVEDYADRCGGGILETEGDGILTEVFRRYFNAIPPFEPNASKKAEFPDAAALLVLESFAEENETLGIVVSNDGGWHNFAASSEYLYCARSLDELTKLFIATSDVSTKIKAAILDSINDRQSRLRMQLSDELKNHIDDATWFVGLLTTDVGSSIDGEVTDTHLADHEIIVERTDVWMDEEDPTKWLIEVTASIKVDVTIDVITFGWDVYDRDEARLSNDSVDRVIDVDITAFLTCTDVNAASAPQDWEVEIDIAPGIYTVDVGEVKAFPWDE